MQHLITHLVTASPATYGIVFGIVAVDALLPFAQAEATVITASVLAAEGRLSIWLIVPLVALAGFVGDNAAYLVGRTLGWRAVGRFVKRKRLEQARRGIRRKGMLLILVARFLPVGRTLTTLAAGSLEMSWPRFALADAIAAIAWACYASMLGYVGGATFANSLWKPLVFALGIAVLLAVAIEVYRRIQKRNGKELLSGQFH